MNKFLLVLIFSGSSLCQGILLDKGITSISGAYVAESWLTKKLVMAYKWE
ncbi:MAG: hypothetical protein R6W90_15380 [Ignavibacteriaceae bacterium]